MKCVKNARLAHALCAGDEGDVLMGVLSLFDVAKKHDSGAKLENQLLKAYIRDWPEDPENQERTNKIGDWL